MLKFKLVLFLVVVFVFLGTANVSFADSCYWGCNGNQHLVCNSPDRLSDCDWSCDNTQSLICVSSENSSAICNAQGGNFSCVDKVYKCQGIDSNGEGTSCAYYCQGSTGLDCGDNGGGGGGPPPPPPPSLSVDINANPSTINWNQSSTLSWSSSSANSCSASGDWSGSKALSGSESTGNLTQVKTYSYTLTCAGSGGGGGLSCLNVNSECKVSETQFRLSAPGGGCGSGTACDSNGNISGSCEDCPCGNTSDLCSSIPVVVVTVQDSVSVNVLAPVPNNPSNITVAQPNYCVSGPSATVAWTFFDPSGSPQQSYQVQIDDQGSFQSSEVDSGKVNSGSTSYFSGQGSLQFNVTYKARIRVWNSYDQVSGWTESGSFKTPNFAYPQVNFTWSIGGVNEPSNPPKNSSIQFTDQTVFGGNPLQREWSWLFGDGTSSVQQNPAKAYTAEGTYYVTLTAEDSQSQSCSRTRGPLSIQKPIPVWKEVAPK